MSGRRFSSEFQKEAARLVVDLQHPVSSVSKRLGVPEKSLNQWVNAYCGLKEQVDADELLALVDENRSLKQELGTARKELEDLRRLIAAGKNKDLPDTLTS